MKSCRHDEEQGTRLRLKHCKKVVDRENRRSTKISGFESVGARGFEPPTSCTPCKRASRAAPRPDWQAVL